jgi:hypothetical protein
VSLMQPLAVLGADEVKKLSPLEAVRELSHAVQERYRLPDDQGEVIEQRAQEEYRERLAAGEYAAALLRKD